MFKQRNVMLLLENYDHRIHHGVARYAGQHHWHLNANMVKTGLLPQGWQGDGIITALGSRSDLVEFVREAGIPAVDVAAMRTDIKIHRVVGDNELIGRMAAEHFLERGVRHFAWFSMDFSNVGRQRHLGYSATLQQHGFTCERLTWSEVAAPGKDGWPEMRAWLGRQLRSLPKPLAVFAYNDYDAANVIDTCLFKNICVPDDVAVLGVDNNEMVCLCQSIPLSSINHDLERIGYEAATQLHRLMLGKPMPKAPLLIPPKGITTRRSTEFTAVNQPEIRQALLFIREHYQRSIGTTEVAQATGLSRRTLEKMFKLELKRSIHEEILRLRMAHVRGLLLTTDLSIKEIAEQTGFCHASHLNNAFREQTGVTPLKFRNAQHPH